VVGEDLVELVRVLRTALVAFEPEFVSGDDCAVLAEELATTEKVCAAARVRAAARAGACGAHKERGFADVSDWMARASGSTAGSAKAALDTAAALDRQPDVGAAVKSGELSLAQARELVRTEAECPGSANDLLDVARHNSLKTLKEEARDRRVRAIDPEELHRLQHAAQHARHWRTKLGNIVITAELPPEFGVPLANRLDAETDRLWRDYRQGLNRKRRNGCTRLFEAGSGGPDGPDPLPASHGSDGLNSSDSAATKRRATLAADAFVRMFETGGRGKAQQADLVIVCDLRAYRRGSAEGEEACHIIGGGPIPVSLARELGKDAFLKAVLHDGTEIHTIAHFGRRYPAVLRTALMLGAPPKFEGRMCSEPGCDRRYHLETDHIDPCANGGETSYTNLASPCWPHHRTKTERDRKAGLLGGKPRAPD
jgi:Domain of unknown function (DUF222)/HNH endonuclease